MGDAFLIVILKQRTRIFEIPVFCKDDDIFTVSV